MNIYVLNACLLLSWALISGGAASVWGWGIAMIVCGAVLVALCVFALFVAGGVEAGPGGSD